MNGVHDLGGMHGFGPVIPEHHEPVFHADWERRTFALRLAMGASRRFNTDEFRRTIERMPPVEYLATSYYEHWLYALEALLAEKGAIAKSEIDARIDREVRAAHDQWPAAAASGDGDSALWSDQAANAGRRSSAVALRHDPRFKARFKAGDRVIARNLNPAGHTRLPRYTRGRRGIIHRDWGTFVLPDTHAHGAGANPEHCYAVGFTARELWGPGYPANERVFVDLWESYLNHDQRATTTAKQKGPKPQPGTRTSKASAVRSTKSIARESTGKRVRSTVARKPARKRR